MERGLPASNPKRSIGRSHDLIAAYPRLNPPPGNHRAAPHYEQTVIARAALASYCLAGFDFSTTHSATSQLAPLPPHDSQPTERGYGYEAPKSDCTPYRRARLDSQPVAPNPPPLSAPESIFVVIRNPSHGARNAI